MAPKTQVEPMDPEKKSSPKADPASQESTVVIDTAANKCFWNDEQFADGALVECEGETYECTYGRWMRLG